MGKMPTYKELIAKNKEEIIILYEEKLEQFSAVPSFWLDELIRREQREHNQALRRYTSAIVIMTAIITISTIINIFF